MRMPQRIASFLTRNGWNPRYRARVLDDAEASAAWPRLDAVYSTFAKYRARSSRTIHVVELSPITGSAVAADAAQTRAA